MISSVRLHENQILRLQLLPKAVFADVQGKMQKLKSGKEYLTTAYIRDVSTPLSSCQIMLDDIIPWLEKYFTQEKYIENREFLIYGGFHIADVKAFRINEFSWIFVSYDKQNAVQDIFFELCLERQEEYNNIQNLFSDIASHELIFLDWREMFVADVTDTASLSSYFSTNIERCKKYYERLNGDVRRFLGGSKLQVLGVIFFILLGAAPISYQATELLAIFVNNLQEQIALVLFYLTTLALLLYRLLFWGLFREVVFSRNTLVIKGLSSDKEIYYQDIEGYTEQPWSIILHLKVGKCDKVRLNMFSLDDSLLMQEIKDVIPSKKRITPQERLSYLGKDLNRNKTKNDVFFSECCEQVLHEVGYFKKRGPTHKNKFKTYKERFFDEFGDLSGYHYGLGSETELESFHFGLQGFEPKKEVAYLDYQTIVGESLEFVGRVYNAKYLIYISTSGKLYCSYRNYLLFYGKAFYDGMDRLLCGFPPISVIDCTAANKNIFDHMSEEWNIIVHTPLLLGAIYRDFFSIDDSLSDKPLLPLLVNEGNTEFIVFNLEDNEYYHLHRHQESEDEEVKILVTQMKEDIFARYVSMRHFSARFVFPAEYCDEVTARVSTALALDLSGADIRSIFETTGVEKITYFPKKEDHIGNYFAISKENPDWNYLYAFYSDVSIMSMNSILDEMYAKGKEKYGVIYDNFEQFYKKFPKTFFDPVARLSSLSGYVKPQPKKKDFEDFVEYSIAIDARTAHEVVIDICSLMGFSIDLDYFRRVNFNDGIPGIHCLAMFSDVNSGEFVVVDCENTDREYLLVVRSRKQKGGNIKIRLLEWKNFFRYQAGDTVDYVELTDEFGSEASMLSEILEHYRISEQDIYLNDPELQFASVDGWIHRVKRYLRDHGYLRVGR